MIYKSNFGTYNAKLIMENYQDGNIVIQLIDEEDGIPITRVTASFKELKFGEVAIKNHSENEGILQWLIENAIVNPPHKFIESGYCTYPVCKMKAGFKVICYQCEEQIPVEESYMADNNGDERIFCSDCTTGMRNIKPFNQKSKEYEEWHRCEHCGEEGFEEDIDFRSNLDYNYCGKCYNELVEEDEDE